MILTVHSTDQIKHIFADFGVSLSCNIKETINTSLLVSGIGSFLDIGHVIVHEWHKPFDCEAL